MSKQKNVFFEVSRFIVITAIVSFFLAEVVFAFSAPFLNKGIFQYDPDIGFRIKPGAQGSNQLGFNDRDYSFEKEPGKYRVAVLGDSFNWMGGLKDNYATFLEEKFEKFYGEHKVDVINMGYPMLNPEQELATLKKYGLLYHPDLVVLGFFAGNDFFDSRPNERKLILNDTFITVNPRHIIHFFGIPIIPKSRIIAFVRNKLQIFFSRNDVNPVKDASFSKKVFLNIERKRMLFYHVPSFQKRIFHEHIRIALDAIEQMNLLLKSKNIDFTVAIYPEQFSVEALLAEEIFKTYKLNSEEHDLSLVQKVLKSDLDRQGIAHVDLLPVFQEKSRTQELYLLQDTHWNLQGNQLAADVLFETLRPKADLYFSELKVR